MSDEGGSLGLAGSEGAVLFIQLQGGGEGRVGGRIELFASETSSTRDCIAALIEELQVERRNVCIFFAKAQCMQVRQEISLNDDRGCQVDGSEHNVRQSSICEDLLEARFDDAKSPGLVPGPSFSSS